MLDDLQMGRAEGEINAGEVSRGQMAEILLTCCLKTFWEGTENQRQWFQAGEWWLHCCPEQRLDFRENEEEGKNTVVICVFSLYYLVNCVIMSIWLTFLLDLKIKPSVILPAKICLFRNSREFQFWTHELQQNRRQVREQRRGKGSSTEKCGELGGLL